MPNNEFYKGTAKVNPRLHGRCWLQTMSPGVPSETTELASTVSGRPTSLIEPGKIQEIVP
jgi:hypothetical protein